MKKFALLMTILFTFGFVGLANALLITFDDLEFSGAYGSISYYNEFTFNKVSYVMETKEFRTNSGYCNGMVSPNNALFTNYDNMIVARLDIPFEYGYGGNWHDYNGFEHHVVIDDIKYIYQELTPINISVPEPTIIIFFGIGLMTLGFTGRKKLSS